MESHKKINFFKISQNQFIDASLDEKCDLIMLPFELSSYIYEKLGWENSIDLEIQNASKETKIDYYSNHYLCGLQFKDSLGNQDDGFVVILKNDYQNILLYDNSTNTCEKYIEIINKTLSKLHRAEYLSSLIIYALIRNDIENDKRSFIELEKTILQLELSLTSNSKNIQSKILELRKILSALKSHYSALYDTLEDIDENPLDYFDDKSLLDYKRLADKVDRLYKNTNILNEYINQIRETYQAQLDIGLNAVMKFFTVISTIFLPLMLIVGWYGMNFETMPEIKSSYGYIYVILLSLGALGLSMWYIKTKGFLD